MKITKKPTPLMVDFNPDPGATNGLIIQFNELSETKDPQQMSTRYASMIAAIAFVMHSSNSTKLISDLFKTIVEDAGAQYRNREAAIAATEAKEATKQ